MGYEQIDPILKPWAVRHGLSVMTESRDWEVRAIQIVDDAGDSYDLWVDPLKNDGTLCVSVTERGRPRHRQTFATSIAELGATLDSAYAAAQSWMRERGHTRTAV
jgi:hypothetical protein